MSLVPIREVVTKAIESMDAMDEERRSLPSSAWERGDEQLYRFFKAAWPTDIGQSQ